ncbi:hypothetical protein OHO83_11645 [Streptomyces sp. NBC_00569]|uniref:hypothetical protein n=1 Tax=Streptomyces sp. NBC_00569 TaxID=2975780 RepID=UPI002E81E78A|nr:hypothetical protein [Streptomyces sp. NBC_00569]WUB92887.1 hypothetical protein OHO83_11645 [Streptomyces sp. NBC_00569]
MTQNDWQNNVLRDLLRQTQAQLGGEGGGMTASEVPGSGPAGQDSGAGGEAETSVAPPPAPGRARLPRRRPNTAPSPDAGPGPSPSPPLDPDGDATDEPTPRTVTPEPRQASAPAPRRAASLAARMAAGRAERPTPPTDANATLAVPAPAPAPGAPTSLLKADVTDAAPVPEASTDGPGDAPAAAEPPAPETRPMSTGSSAIPNVSIEIKTKATPTPVPPAEITDARPSTPVTDARPSTPVTDATPPAPVADATPPAPVTATHTPGPGGPTPTPRADITDATPPAPVTTTHTPTPSTPTPTPQANVTDATPPAPSAPVHTPAPAPPPSTPSSPLPSAPAPSGLPAPYAPAPAPAPQPHTPAVAPHSRSRNSRLPAVTPESVPTVDPRLAGALGRAQHGDTVARRTGRSLRRLASSAAQEVSEETRLARELQQPVANGRVVAVTSIRGGVGKTTVSALLARTLNHYRHDPVLALEADAALGTLPVRLGAESVRWSCPDLAQILKPSMQLTDVTGYLVPVTDGGWLLPASQGRVGAPLDVRTYRTLSLALRRYFAVTVVDCETLPGEVARTAMDTAHARVVVAPMTVEGVGGTRVVLDWLAQLPKAALAATVVALTSSAPDMTLDLKAATAHLRETGVAVVHLPYDRHLAAGGPIRTALLSEATRRAATGLAAEAVQRAAAAR